MANAVYPTARTAILNYALLNTGGFNAFDVRAVLVTSTYTYNTAHDFYNDLTGTISSAVALTSEAVSGAFFDSANVTFPSVAGGTTFNAVVLYQHTGTDSTANLLAYIDTTSDASLPVTSNGGDITVNVNAGGWISLPTTQVYQAAANAILEKGILNTGGLNSNDLYVTLATASYTPTESTDDFLNDVTGTTTTGVQLTSETIGSVGAGIYDAGDATFSSVTGGTTFTQWVIYAHTGVSTTANLICNGTLSSSVLSNGGDIVLQFDAGGILQI